MSLAEQIAMSAGMGCGVLHVVCEPGAYMWSAGHADYSKFGEWAWVGRATRKELDTGWHL